MLARWIAQLAALLTLVAACEPVVGDPENATTDTPAPPEPLPVFAPAPVEPAPEFDPRALSPQARGAWRRLRTAPWYGSLYNDALGGHGDPRQTTLDAAALLREERRDALLDLVAHATPAGVLCALHALRSLDPDTYAACADELADDPRAVGMMHGCLGSESTLGAALSEVADHPPLSDFLARITREKGGYDWLGRRRGLLEPAYLREVLEQPASLAAFESLHAARVFDPADPAHAAALAHLVEHERRVLDVALVLYDDESAPAARLWGAVALVRIRPQTYDVLRPELTIDRRAFPCMLAGRRVELGPREALERYVDPER